MIPRQMSLNQVSVKTPVVGVTEWSVLWESEITAAVGWHCLTIKRPAEISAITMAKAPRIFIDRALLLNTELF